MAYTLVKQITISHTKVPSNQTDFPVTFSGTFTYLKSTGNGGSVQHASGYDIVFASDAAGSSILPFERVFWINSSGACEFHIKVNLSSSVDTVIYLCIGNSSITTDQQSVAAVWSNNFGAVYHMNNSGNTWYDATGVNNGTRNDVSIGPTDGYFGGTDQGLTRSNAGTAWYVDIGHLANVFDGVVSVITVEAWVNSVQNNNESQSIIIGSASLTTVPYFRLIVGDTGGGSSTSILFGTGASYSIYQQYVSTTTVTTGVWNHWVFELDLGTPSNSKTYLNGSAVSVSINQAGTPHPTTFTALTQSLWLMQHATEGHFWGVLDEIRFSKVARSADWVATQYNNQSDQSTFYTVTDAGLFATIADTLTLSDALSGFFTQAASASDTLTFSDATSFLLPLGLAKIDTLNNWLDTNTRLYSIVTVPLTRTAADSFIVNTGPVKFSWKDGYVTDTRPDTELNFHIDDLSSNLKDDLIVSMPVFFNNTEVQAYDTLQYDMLDEIGIDSVVKWAIGNSFTIIDSIALLNQFGLRVTDALAQSDTHGTAQNYYPDLSDSLVLSDAIVVNPSVQLNQLATDTLSMTDGLDSYLDLIGKYVNVYDTLNMLDASRQRLYADLTSYIRRYLNDVKKGPQF